MIIMIMMMLIRITIILMMLLLVDYIHDSSGLRHWHLGNLMTRHNKTMRILWGFTVPDSQLRYSYLTKTSGYQNTNSSKDARLTNPISGHTHWEITWYDKNGFLSPRSPFSGHTHDDFIRSKWEFPNGRTKHKVYFYIHSTFFPE